MALMIRSSIVKVVFTFAISHDEPSMMRGAVAICVLGLSFACSTSVSGDAQRARQIEGQVWSPYCPGQLLADCSTQQSRELREEIADRVEAGETTDEVLDWVRAEYGDAAIARPETSGRGLVVWLVPLALFLIGAGVVVRFVSRNVDRTTPNEPTNEEDTHAGP